MILKPESQITDAELHQRIKDAIKPGEFFDYEGLMCRLVGTEPEQIERVTRAMLLGGELSTGLDHRYLRTDPREREEG